MVPASGRTIAHTRARGAPVVAFGPEAAQTTRRIDEMLHRFLARYPPHVQRERIYLLHNSIVHMLAEQGRTGTPSPKNSCPAWSTPGSSCSPHPVTNL